MKDGKDKMEKGQISCKGITPKLGKIRYKGIGARKLFYNSFLIFYLFILLTSISFAQGNNYIKPPRSNSVIPTFKS